jgi:8-oxo-dGTP pyrophosphatase MutT (NUDIX family)
VTPAEREFASLNQPGPTFPEVGPRGQPEQGLQEVGPRGQYERGFRGVGPRAQHGRDGEIPGWLRDLAAAARTMSVPPELRPPPGGGRRSAILILFGAGPDGTGGPDLLLVQRSQTLRRHAGQPAFPGGVIDPEDDGPAEAALREAAEEAHVDPAGVEIVSVLPDLYIPRTGYQVSPVVGWWRDPAPIAPGDPAEVTAVARIPVAELADPASRIMIRYPNGGSGPAFRAGSMLIWGFTAFVLGQLLQLGGWERPWDTTSVVELPPGAGLTGVA